ncbi:MAG: hypothetical protein EOP54_17595 [Sphingobacteriales bacterium]|nr:MAG: hypothetical protein EOP54_17595 [Sphingobacteriales bacterium]
MLKGIAILMILIGGLLMLFSSDVEIASEQVNSAGNTNDIVTSETIIWQPYLGGLLLLGGFVILATRKKQVADGS